MVDIFPIFSPGSVAIYDEDYDYTVGDSIGITIR